MIIKKRLNKINKKLHQIVVLERKYKNGEELQSNQKTKIQSKNELEEEKNQIVIKLQKFYDDESHSHSMDDNISIT